jgi:hypothetical protein
MVAWWCSLFTEFDIDLDCCVAFGNFNLRFGSSVSSAVGACNLYRQKQSAAAKGSMPDEGEELFPSTHLHVSR